MTDKGVNKVKLKYLNDFPLVITIIVAIIVVVLLIMYFSIKPYTTIFTNGYMVSSKNMTSNLIGNNKTSDEFDIGVASVTNGDYVYRRMDSYYVGIDEKQEVDYNYPIYSIDGLTIYNINENVTLIDRNFEKIKGYSGFYLNYGILYNNDGIEPADDIDYLLLYLNNSIYINAQTIVIKTEMNEYTIPMHSSIYFDKEYINYYLFNGKKFEYNNIPDIYYDSVIKLGDVTLTYREFLSQMELIEIENENSEEEEKAEEIIDSKEEEKTEQEESKEDDGTIEKDYIKPIVKVSEFKESVYFATAELTIKDPSGVIKSDPMFEIYTMDDKLYSRNRFSSFGEIKITGLTPNTKYKIIGTYKYENEKGLPIVATFYEGEITTKGVDFLNEIKLNSKLGDIHQNKIEIKNLKIENYGEESVNSIKRIELEVKEEDKTKTETYKLTYPQIQSLVKGEEIIYTTPKNLKSNTVYEYEFKFYDKESNELVSSGDIKGSVKTSKKAPTVNFTSNVDIDNNIISLKLKTNNEDDVYIKDYKYRVYTYSGTFVSEGELNYKNDAQEEIIFDNLDYNANYIFIVTGIYDLEDGKGEQELKIEKEFTTVNLKQGFTAWYDDETVEVTHNSIKTDIYIAKNNIIFEKETTEIEVYLTDAEGNDILDEEGNLKYSKKYTNKEYNNPNDMSYHIKSVFEGLKSGTEYNIKIKTKVKQMEQDKYLEKVLTPNITTKIEESYINVINKRLIGDNLKLLLQVNDPDYLLEDGTVIVEIYKGKLSHHDELNDYSERYVYRNAYNIKESNKININLEGYLDDNYTVFISSNNYNKSKVKKYIYIKDSLNTKPTAINLDRMIDAHLEMHSQEEIGDPNLDYTYYTKIGLEYNLYETVEDVFVIDCYNGTCENLGYFSNEVFNATESDNRYKNRYRSIEEDINNSNKKIIKIVNKKDNVQHKFYLAIEKEGIDLTDTNTFKEILLNNYVYELSSLTYDTSKGYTNISKASDLFNYNFSVSSTRYVVTGNIDFNDADVKNKSKKLKLTTSIDFQGYELNLYADSNQKLYLFDEISSTGSIKNMVLNLNYNHHITNSFVSFVRNNYGSLENIIVNINQIDNGAKIYVPGMLVSTNFETGKINNFVINLNSDLRPYSTTNLVANDNKGIISNGYITSSDNSKKIILNSLAMNMLSISTTNSGKISNIYNLVSMEGTGEITSSYALAHVSQTNTGEIENVLSVATLPYISNGELGPNVLNNNNGTVLNNYYIDTNVNNPSYTNKYNKKLNKSVLLNATFLNLLLNSENEFNIMTGYYPTLKMSSFMDGKQIPIRIPYDFYNEKNIDIIYADPKTIVNNNDGSSTIKLQVHNPNKYEITRIELFDISSKINKIEYDEATQVSTVTLELYVGRPEDIAKSQYTIKNLKYDDGFGNELTRDYSNDSRIIEIDVYKPIFDYTTFINSINTNENIILKEDIRIDRDMTLPNENHVYTGILNGNEKTLSLDANDNIGGNRYAIERGYFLYQVDNEIKNLQIKNMKLTGPNNNSTASMGFIAILNGKLNNIDLSDSYLHINNKNTKTTGGMYVGGVVGQAATNSEISKVSVNNLEIKRTDDDYFVALQGTYVGGIVGLALSTNISDSYAYNLNIPIFKYGTERDTKIGGIVGDTRNNSKIERCYSTGNIDSDYTVIGGIVGGTNNSLGINNTMIIQNNYSYTNLFSEGSFAGGIVGHVNDSSDYLVSVTNNMFLGTLKSPSISKNFKLIIGRSIEGDVIQNNKVLFEEEGYEHIVIEDTKKLSTYLTGFSEKSLEENDLPYLNESSFVDQQIMDDEFINLNENIEYELAYEDNKSCLNSNKIESDDGKWSNPAIIDENGVLISDLYTNACSTYATMKLLNSNYEIDLDSEENKENLIITKETEDNTYKLVPKKHYDYYKIKLKSKYSSNENFVYVDAAFYRPIKTIEDWNNIVPNENIILYNNISNETIKGDKFINKFLGNNYSISDIKISTQTLINTLKRETRDIKFSSITNTNTNKTEDFYVIRNNFSKMQNILFDDIKLSTKGNNVSVIYENTSGGFSGIINNIYFNNINISSGKNASIVLINRNTINNIKLNKIRINTTLGASGLNMWNYGNIENINATDIIVTGKQLAGLVYKQYEGGSIKNVSFDTIDVSATTIAAGLTLEAEKGSSIENIIGKNIKVKGTSYVGGIASNVIQPPKNIKGDNITITSNGNYSGGLIGMGGCTDCSISNSKILYSSGGYIGGISGNGNYAIKNSHVNNLIITTNNETKTGERVGGIAGSAINIQNSSVNNLKICKIDEEGNCVDYLKNYSKVGGIAGYSSSSGILHSKVSNSYIAAKNNVGGIAGINEIKSNYNIVSKSSIKGIDNVGGIIGYNNKKNTIIEKSQVLDSTIEATNNSGGIVGFMENINATDNSGIYLNLVLKAQITASSNAGGIIGRLYKIPNVTPQKYKNNLFYNNSNADISLIGNVERDINGNEINDVNEKQTIINEYVYNNNFKEYVTYAVEEPSYKINNYESLNAFMTSLAINLYDFGENTGRYFPLFEHPIPYKDEDYIEIPDGQAMTTFSTFRMLNYATSYKNPLNIDFDVYASGVDKINIEFDRVDNGAYFYYEVGEYKSNYIPLTQRTYTLTYDFNQPIKVYVSNGYDYKEKIIKENELARTINLLGDKTYYINLGMLYSEDKVITGNFKNLYGNEALTKDNKIYNIYTKQETDANITYELLGESTPIYETSYKGNDIKTYYNYSIVNGDIKEIQMFVKNSNLSSISSSVNNKKNMYILDYYNNNEIQIVLGNDGKLYSVKENIKYPNEFVNKDIKEIYTDINSTNNIVVVKYENGGVCTFDYRTGKLLFNNISKGDVSLFDYIKDKLNNSSNDKVIENVTGYDKYEEISLLKNKIKTVSLEEANDKIYNSNDSSGKKEDYITVYNAMTRNYELYKESDLLNNTVEIESETEKMYKNYELVKFYKTMGKQKNKTSVSGVVLFTCSIILTIITLILLIRHRINKKGEVL